MSRKTTKFPECPRMDLSLKILIREPQIYINIKLIMLTSSDF